MTYHGKEYTNTKMGVWLVNRFGKKSQYWYRVFEDKGGVQYIKHGDRMVALAEFKIFAIAPLF